jgi:hypothetical protein
MDSFGGLDMLMHGMQVFKAEGASRYASPH